MSDLKFALRQLRKSPGFTLVAVLTLALGIGANTAIFSVVEGVLLRPLPFPNAERLVRIYEALDENGARSATLNLSDRTTARFREFGRDIFEDVAGGTGGASVVSAKAGSPAQTVPAALVTYNFFDVLGLPPSQGRNFTREEGSDKAANVVIISDDFWRNTLNSRRDVLGSTIVIDGTPRTIIGVMPKAFRHPYRASLWLPLALEPDNPATINNHYLYGVARLRPGVTPVKAEEAVKRMCATINRDDPNPANVRAAYIPPLRESFVMDLRPKILVIVGAAVCALLIAAANFAGLLLARVIEREGEFALRAALGASRRRLVRQQLIQALLLALAGTALGLLIAFWITPMLFALSPEGADATGSAMREFDYAARLDLPVFAFAAGVMTLVGLGFGLLPAVRAARTDLRGAMSVTSRGATLDRSARRLLGSFVVIELAIAAALLTASVTATQYFRKLIEEPWGFETKDRLAFNVTVPDRFFPTAAAKQSGLETSLAQLQQVPGVKSATVVSPSPMDAPWTLMPFNAEGAPAPEPVPRGGDQASQGHDYPDDRCRCQRGDREDGTTMSGGLPGARLRHVTDFIDDNLGRPLPLAELSAQAHLSPYHFTRLFKQSTGVSPHRFVVQRRVERARALLEARTLSIKAVVQSVGFHSLSHFSTTFRRVTGSQPTVYRTTTAGTDAPETRPPAITFVREPPSDRSNPPSVTSHQ